MAQGATEKQVPTMTVAGMEVSKQITFGQIIQFLGLILAGGSVVVSVAMYSESMNARLDAFEKEAAATAAQFDRHRTILDAQAVRISLVEVANARAEEQLNFIRGSVVRIEQKLDGATQR